MRFGRKRLARLFSPRTAVAAAPSFLLEPLEPRLLLSADPLAAVAGIDVAAMTGQQAIYQAYEQAVHVQELGIEVQSQLQSTGLAAEHLPEPLDLSGLASLLQGRADLSILGSASSSGREGEVSPPADPGSIAHQEIVFVDSSVDDYQTLLQAIPQSDERTQYQVVLLQADADGVQQISAALAGLSDVDAVHLIAHGNDGAVRLGNSVLNAATLADYQADLAGWNRALDSGADLLIYGCNLAGSQAGIQLLGSVGQLTGADIAASNDLTGSARLGGDWDLEYKLGDIAAGSAFAPGALQQWQGVLALQAYEPFAYGAGTLEGANGGSGWATGWITNEGSSAVVHATGLGSPTGTLPVQGGTAVMNTGPLFSQSRDLLSSLGGDGTTVWLSFLLEADVVFGEGISLELGDGGAYDKVTIGTNDDDFMISQNRLIPGASFINNAATDAQTYLLVAKMEFAAGNDTVTLYLDPTPGLASPDSASTAQLISADLGSFNQIAIMGGYLGNTSAIDEIRIGDSFADVAPAINSSPVADAAAGAPYSILEGDSLSLDGSDSFDPDGTISDWDWDIGDNGSFEKSGETVGYSWAELGLAGVTGEGIVDVTLRVTDNDGDQSVQTFQVTVTAPSPYVLWLSTNGSATDDNAAVIDGEDIVAFDNPDLGLELGDGATGTTDGTFATEHAVAENVRALHYVNSNVTVDTLVGGTPGSYDLQPGQIVLSMRASPSADFSLPTVGGGSITVNNTDVLVYTPLTGEYEFLLEDAIFKPDGTTPANIHAVSIVEQTTTIGADTVVQAGSYLIARSDPAVHADISTYDNTNGRRDLLLGVDFLSDPGRQIQGLELLEADLDLGGATLNQGTLLITVQVGAAQTVGTSGGTTVAVEDVDVIALTINATEQDSAVADTNVDAQILFDGSDISLSTMINGLSIAGNDLTGANNDAPVLDNTGAMALRDVSQDNANPLGDRVDQLILSAGGDRITDADAADPEGIAVIGVNDSDGSWEYSLDGGDSWISFVVSGVADGVTDDTAAVLLDEAARIRFVPDAGHSGSGGAISFLAWDQTSGSIGQTGVDVSNNGNSTAFSVDVETATVSVRATAGISNTVPAIQGGTEDTPLVFSVAGLNPVSVSDGSTSDATLRVTLSSSNGILTLSDTTGLTFLSGADGSASMTFIGLETAINVALDGLTFDPTTGYSGAANVQVTTEHAANLEGLYSFDDPATPVTLGNNDAPDGGPNAAVSGATDVADGFRGQVAGFGGGDYAEIAGQFSNPTDVTLAAWVNLADGAGNAEVISIGDRVILRLDMGFSGLGVFGSFNNGSGYDVTSDGIFVNGTGWHHVAYTIDDANNVQRLYIDGQLVASTSHTSSIAYGGGLNTSIGSHANTSSYFMDGLIDDARIYSRALTAGEVNALFSDTLSDTSNVAITITAGNSDPTLDNPIGDQAATENSPFSFTFAADSFGDADGDALTYKAQLAGGSALPAWLSFDGATRTFSGTPANGDVGTITVDVMADDLNGGTPASDTFDIVVGDVNNAPTGSVTLSGTPIEDQLLSVSDSLADADGMASAIAYQWQRNGADISGETGNTYTLVRADVGATVTVVASYTDGGGMNESVSSAGVIPIAKAVPPNPPSVPPPESPVEPPVEPAIEPPAESPIEPPEEPPEEPPVEPPAEEPVDALSVPPSGSSPDTIPAPPDALLPGKVDTGYDFDAVSNTVELDAESDDPESDDVAEESPIVVAQTGAEGDRRVIFSGGEDVINYRGGIQDSLDLDGLYRFKTSLGDSSGLSSLIVNALSDRDPAVQAEALNTIVDTVMTAFSTFIDPLMLVGSPGFSDGLDEMRENLRDGIERNQTVLGGTVTLTAGFSVGYVVWLARSGVLISAAMSALPAWRFMDPLPILALGSKQKNDTEDEESLESMIENSAEADESPAGGATDDQLERNQ